MNILAHALLGAASDDLMLGNLMGDFVHGPVPAGLRPGVEAGIRLHRAIDTYTDSHDVVRELRNGFAPPFRRYAGVILDIWFDHLLARDFACWSDVPLDAFSNDVMRLLHAHADELPLSMRNFVAYMERRGLPAAYADRTVITRVFEGVATRFTRANPLARAVEAIAPNEAAIDAGFAAFFPDLRQFAAAQAKKTPPEGGVS